MKKKLLRIMLIAVGLLIVWNHLPCYHNNNMAVAYITNVKGWK